LEFHHVGCVVQSIEEYLHDCIAPLGLDHASEVYNVSSQRVRVCFVRLSTGAFLELVQPTKADSPVETLRKLGGGYYHLCFLVDDIPTAATELANHGFIREDMFVSEAFGGRRCCFLINPFGHMVELAERAPVAAS
jgi:hypothetical protein